MRTMTNDGIVRPYTHIYMYIRAQQNVPYLLVQHPVAVVLAQREVLSLERAARAEGGQLCRWCVVGGGGVGQMTIDSGDGFEVQSPTHAAMHPQNPTTHAPHTPQKPNTHKWCRTRHPPRMQDVHCIVLHKSLEHLLRAGRPAHDGAGHAGEALAGALCVCVCMHV